MLPKEPVFFDESNTYNFALSGGIVMTKGKIFISFLVLLSLTIFTSHASNAQSVLSPESFLGFKIGTDYKLADWHQIVDYFQQLTQGSPRITVQELGKTNQGRPFIMAVITSEENHKNLQNYKNITRKLAQVDNLSDDDARNLSKEGKIVVLITCSIHASEVGAAQASMNIAYRLATENSTEITRILDNVIFLLVPSFNPDGLVLVKDWYDKYLQTPYESSQMPWLYHPYTGHDNNRDSYLLTQPESRYIIEILYKEWFPQIYLDMHQMGNASARLFLPPYTDPVNPNINPTVLLSTSFIGQKIATEMTADGLSGIVTGTMYNAWWQGAFKQDAWYHNVIGLLSEMASVTIASPIFQEIDELKGGGQGMKDYSKTINFPMPWPGGWWRLSDIVTYEIKIAFSLLNIAATDREMFLYNFYKMGKEAIAKGSGEPPFAFLIPPEQIDPSAARVMIDVLMKAGVRIHTTHDRITADGLVYPPETIVIKMDQPYRSYAKSLLERQKYPDLREYTNGPPIPPYDMAGWTLPLQMGVKVVEVMERLEGNFIPIDEPPAVENKSLPNSGYAYLLRHEENQNFKALNTLLQQGVPAYFAEKDFSDADRKYTAGSILIPVKEIGSQRMQFLADTLSLDVAVINIRPMVKGYSIKNPRLGIYQPWTANMSEGWSRWVLEQYKFSHKLVHNAELKAGSLRERYDALFIPDVWAEAVVEGRPEGSAPPLYTGGIGIEGLNNLKTFVQEGGILITLDTAAEIVIGEFGLPVVNVVKDLKNTEFFCPGSILSAEVKTGEFLTYGIPPSMSIFFARSPAFKLIPSFQIEGKVLVKYPSRHVLQSGWILGEKYINQQAALIDFPIEKGHIILIGFEAIQRAQAHGSFKFLFNAIYYGTATLGELP